LHKKLRISFTTSGLRSSFSTRRTFKICRHTCNSTNDETLGVIQGTLGVIQGTLGVIQGTFRANQGTFGVIAVQLLHPPHIQNLPAYLHKHR
jgi:hypothetical protein